MCNDYFDDTSATVICKEMGYVGSKSWSSVNKWSFVQRTYDIVLDDIECRDADGKFEECSYTERENCGHSEDVFLTCKGKS